MKNLEKKNQIAEKFANVLIEKIIEKNDTDMKTYDIHFNDETDSNNKNMKVPLQEAMDYIEAWNGTNHSYFEDYKGGIVSIVCNETGETVFEEVIK